MLYYDKFVVKNRNLYGNFLSIHIVILYNNMIIIKKSLILIYIYIYFEKPYLVIKLMCIIFKRKIIMEGDNNQILIISRNQILIPNSFNFLTDKANTTSLSIFLLTTFYIISSLQSNCCLLYIYDHIFIICIYRFELWRWRR